MIDVLFEDNHLLAVNKPALLPTMGVAEHRESLLTLSKEYIRRKYAKPGNVYLGIVSRLDAPVTGVLVVPCEAETIRLLSIFRLALPTATDWYAVPFVATCDAVKTTGIGVVPTTMLSFTGFVVVLRRMVSVPLAVTGPLMTVAVADAVRA